MLFGLDLNQKFYVTIVPNPSSVCYTSRLQFCIPGSRWHTMECELHSALLWSQAERGSLLSQDSQGKSTIWRSTQKFWLVYMTPRTGTRYDKTHLPHLVPAFFSLKTTKDSMVQHGSTSTGLPLLTRSVIVLLIIKLYMPPAALYNYKHTRIPKHPLFLSLLPPPPLTHTDTHTKFRLRPTLTSLLCCGLKMMASQRKVRRLDRMGTRKPRPCLSSAVWPRHRRYRPMQASLRTYGWNNTDHTHHWKTTKQFFFGGCGGCDLKKKKKKNKPLITTLFLWFSLMHASTWMRRQGAGNGHVLGIKKDCHPYAALTWAPPGKRGRGRPLGTWRRTTEAEMEEAGKT